MDQLSNFGWTHEFSQKWENLDHIGTQPARVVADFGTSLKIAMPEIVTAELSGKLAHYTDRENVPKVGDWVAVRLSDNGYAVIEEVIPRRSEIARKVAGNRTVKQVIAANIDIAFVLLALDNDFSVERLKRFLYQLSINNIEPVIVLNKADKTDDLGGFTDQLNQFDLPIVILTATTGSGVEEIIKFIRPGQTAILLGSSGVGKSTLTNQLLGRDAQTTQAVRESDDTGKHTTVHRELFMLPGGGMLIDTPGIRELQLWGTEEDLDDNYDDIAELISQCKYPTCQHGSEPGCAIQYALHSGALESAHYASYLKMKSELSGLKVKHTERIRLKNRKTRKNINRQARDDLRDAREEMS
ncbi:MAG: ribosome small subunit-dependent GTPase [Candidatus Saccharibacteria bacterium]|nr:ribosome small subunit-dependent GTPase [Candidatus Saccharibacteria bacterium]